MTIENRIDSVWFALFHTTDQSLAIASLSQRAHLEGGGFVDEQQQSVLRLGAQAHLELVVDLRLLAERDLVRVLVVRAPVELDRLRQVRVRVDCKGRDIAITIYSTTLRSLNISYELASW